MTWLFAASILPLLALLSLVAYIDRLYFEMGKLLSREYQENIDVWTRAVEPRLRMGRDNIALSATVLLQLVQIALAMLFTAHLFLPHGQLVMPRLVEVGENIFALVLLIMIAARLLPHVYFMRTRGIWTARMTYFIFALFYLALPITLMLGLMLSIAALTEKPQPEPDAAESQSDAVDALLEAGEEEGILHQTDMDLVRSAVEFGDKVVREVMTPRPEIFAVPGTMSLAEFTASLAEHAFSRVPVYGASLDQITGIAFAHDLLRVADTDAARRIVAGIQRPAEFVPETKKVNELLREMQREREHMRIVVDEYGAVAGIVTIEDLLEEIVGNIADEHDEEHGPDDVPMHEPDGSYVVGGGFLVDRLSELFGDHDLALPQFDATTVGGLVTEMAGRIPLPGEVIETDGLRFEVLTTSDRLIERLRLRALTKPQPAAENGEPPTSRMTS